MLGIDMNPLCVARCVLLFEMLKQGCDIDTIFEYWF
jgi:hypothetical protein